VIAVFDDETPGGPLEFLAVQGQPIQAIRLASMGNKSPGPTSPNASGRRRSARHKSMRHVISTGYLALESSEAAAAVAIALEAWIYDNLP
jgi:hypothetical protein